MPTALMQLVAPSAVSTAAIICASVCSAITHPFRFIVLSPPFCVYLLYSLSSMSLHHVSTLPPAVLA